MMWKHSKKPHHFIWLFQDLCYKYESQKEENSLRKFQIFYHFVFGILSHKTYYLFSYISSLALINPPKEPFATQCKSIVFRIAFSYAFKANLVYRKVLIVIVVFPFVIYFFISNSCFGVFRHISLNYLSDILCFTAAKVVHYRFCFL